MSLITGGLRLLLLAALLSRLGSAPVAAASSNEPVACTPPPHHPYPVVLLHGTMDDSSAWNILSSKLIADGYCVYTPTYGQYPTPIPVGAGVAPIAESAVDVAAYIARVLAVTGAARVDIVGHSQGGTIAEYYAKNLGQAGKVRLQILLAVASHGTDLVGAVEVANQVPALHGIVNQQVLPLFCPACLDLQRGSGFIRALSDGRIAQPGVRYAILATRDDVVVTPAGTASFIDEPGVSNQFVQDLSPVRVTHREMPSNPVVMKWVAAQLSS
ncbi:esterase/lipase family protein [Nocardia sp. NPDC127579]|uniref:esterase/lipase family protein n=1 Tax=Nocardia sp. NPDC127579 TaxID=3345402 RepID=UPI003638803E